MGRPSLIRVSARWLLLGMALAAGGAGADELRLGGHLKYQLAHTDYRSDDLPAVIGDDPAHDHSLELRLKVEQRAGAWDFSAHYELLALHGDTLAARRRLALLGVSVPGTLTGLPDDRRRLFDLTGEVTDRERAAAVHRLDRLAIGRSTPGRVLRFGRQAVSWGNGLVFHPLDFVNPFAPLAIDKDYKTGDDMLYGQWVMGAGADLQAIVLPRRDPVTREIESSQGTAAAKLRLRQGRFDLDLLAARHYDEGVVGLGLVRSVGGAVWRFDASVTDLAGGERSVSAVTNLDYSWVWWGRNFYGYAEYFRNGVGESDRAAYVAPPPALSQRIARGELFTLGRDYAALGLQVELDPLTNLFGNLVRSLNDGSSVWQLRAVYDWRQDVQLMAGVNLPSGERGTEYGGIPAAGGYLGAGRTAYARLAYYF